MQARFLFTSVSITALIAISATACSEATQEAQSTTIPERHFLAVDYDARYGEVPAYRDVSWANELQESTNSGPDTKTRLFNVVGGDRVTLAPDCTCAEVAAWLLVGQRLMASDNVMTIPLHLTSSESQKTQVSG
jgi:hypothetical protein